MKNVIWALSIVLVFMFFSCDDGSSSSDVGHILAGLEIAGAEALFIAPSNESRSASDSVNKIFQITGEGFVEEVIYIDENGDEYSETSSPIYIQNINGEYIVVIFGFDEINPVTGYLVRKSDGAVFDLGEYLPSPQSNGFKNIKMIDIDSQSNMYYLYYVPDATFGQYIRKVNIENPENITSERVNPDTDIISNFTVSNAGDAMYQGYLASNMSVSASRLKKSNGGLYDIQYSYFSHWKGLNGSLFFTGAESDSYNIRQINIDGSYNVTTPVYGSPLSNISASMNDSYYLKMNDRISLYYTNYPNILFEVDNVDSTPRKVTLTGDTINSIIDVAYSNNSYFVACSVANGGTIEKVNPETGSMTQLITPGIYSVFNLIVSDDNFVTFNALRYSDGVKVIGTIDASGNGPYQVEIIDESINSDITSLERIN